MSVWNDVRLAVRMLLRDRSFTFTAASALALGIAANSLVFTLVNGVLLRELPFHEPDRLMAIESRVAGNSNVSYLDLRELQASMRTFSGVAGVDQRSMNIADQTGAAERLTGAYVSANTYGLLGRQPVLGRDFRDEDDRPGAEPVALLGYRLWLRRYGADAAILGRSIRVNGIPSTVIGVMPEQFGFPDTAELWQPLATLPASERERRNIRGLNAIGRLAPNASPQQAATELDTVMAGLARKYPDTNKEIVPTVYPYREAIVGSRAATTFSALMGAVVFLLVLACANVANLLMARASTRAREMSIRLSLGAAPWRIVRQLLVESVVLSLAAGAVGVAIGAAGTRAFATALAATTAPYWLAFPLDARVFAFVAVLCVSTAVIFGLVPSLHASRTSLVGLNEIGRAVAGSRRAQRWTGALVVVQVSLAIVLLTGGGLMLRSVVAQVWRDAGISTEGLVTMRIELPAQRYQTLERRGAFYRQLDDQLAAMPDMRAAIATPAPRMGGPERTVSIEGRPVSSERRPPRVTTVATGQRYFEALGIAPRLGRTFGPLDEGRPVVVVNERFASVHFGGRSALGERIEIGPDGPDIGATGWLTIVGIVPNVRQNDEEETAFDPVAYLPHTTGPLPNAMIVARSTLDVSAIAGSVRRAVRGIDGDLPIFEIGRLDDALARERWPLRIFGSMFGAFAISALVLAVLGLYAVTTYAVAQRTHEIGVRVALGARRRHLWWMVNRRVALQLSIGLVIGLGGAFAMSQVLQGILAGVSGRDPVTLAAVPALLVVAALLACLIPARRAMRLNPVDALRAD
jgi:putative ABC transport system permease protein